jgi:hypothetical protein
MRSRTLLATGALAAIAAVIAGTAFAAPTKVGGSVEFELAPPAGNAREGPFAGELETRKPCRRKRTVTLLPASDNFPNTTGYVVQVTTRRGGGFTGIYEIPGKPGTYSFSLQVEKAKRTVKGTTIVCKGTRATPASVTSS